MEARLARAFFVLVAACAASCGARAEPPYRDGPIDFAFALNGAQMRTSELMGRPLVLVLVRTSEVTSELYVDELVKAHSRIAGDTRLLVLSISPNEAPFLEAYVEERALPFPIGLADWSVAEGSSALGLVPIVPTTYLIDAEGEVVEMIPGAVSADVLERALARRRWE